MWILRRGTYGRVAVVAAVAIGIGASVALATTQPTVFYKPPLIKMVDAAGHNSVENMVVGQQGDALLFQNTPVLPALDPGSDPGCKADQSVGCPKQGVRRIVLLLGALNDSGEIRLDGRTAEKVTQIVKGQDGKDELTGGRGKQKLNGGGQDDTLHGGPGPDVLIGGNGTDICDGGPGRDEFVSCEAAPAR